MSNISNLAQLLGDDLCDALIGVHAFTGCDSVSAFAGRGKLTALKLVKGNRAFQESFKSLGTSWDVSDEIYSNMELFVCRMYAPSSSVCDVNDLRYLLFCTKRGEVESSLLPPCRDCLKLHTACQLPGSCLEALSGRTARHTRTKRTWMDN